MTEVVVIAAINGLVAVASAALTYLGVRSHVDKQGTAVGAKLDVAAVKVEETKQVNLAQIKVSNNFNEKLGKLDQGQLYLIAKTVGVEREIVAIKRDIHTLSEQTGITIGE